MNCFSACNEVLYCWNAKTGVISHTLKANIQDFCIGDLVYAISAKLLLVSNLSSVQKSVLPEPLTCIAASHSSLYILGGGLSGRCYLWDVTGKLLKMFDSHFQQVTRCVFSINDKFLVTSGRDSVINIYDCCDFTKVSLSGHSLAITDLYIGYTVPPNARIYSCSLDKTVKIWDFKMLLASIIFPSALTCLCVNVAETSIFAGSSDSVIYSIDLYGKISSVMQSDESSCFKGHLDQITSIKLSMDESMLVSASKDQSCIVWDTKTRQQLHRFKHPGPITSLHIGPIPEFPNILSTFKKHQEDYDYSTQEYKPIKCEPGQIDDQTSEHHESLLKNMADLVAANNAMYKIIVESGQDK